VDSASSHLPSPAAWSELAARRLGEAIAESGVFPLGPRVREDDASQLRARLLRLIVDSEHARKAAAIEAFNGRSSP